MTNSFSNNIDIEKTLVNHVSEFVDQYVIPTATEYDCSNTYPEALVQSMRDIGLFGLIIPKDFGGLEVSLSTVVAVMAELSRGWLSLSALLGSHMRVCSYISAYGTETQKHRYLESLAKGEIIAANAMNEESTRNPAEFTTQLQWVSGNSLLSGYKPWVTNAIHANLIAVVARYDVDSAPTGHGQVGILLIDPKSTGVIIGDDLPRMGIKGISLCPVQFDNCPVDSTEAIVGGFQLDGQKLMKDSRSIASTIFAARAVGVGKAILKDCINFITSKKSGKIYLSDMPVVRMRLASVATKLKAAENTLEGVLCNLLKGKDILSEAFMCKVFCTEVIQETARILLQLYGGAGYTTGHAVERHLRDAMSLPTIDTPNDILLENIAQIMIEDNMNEKV